MNTFHHSAEQPRSASSGRLEQLDSSLRSLGSQVREAISEIVGEAVGEGVRAAVRRLLGRQPQASPQSVRREAFSDDPWAEMDGPYGREPSFRDQEDEPARPPDSEPARWRNATSAALAGGLWWLQKQHGRRPVLTTSVVALAAGVTAFVAGPALSACAGVVASVAYLLVTADGAGTLAERLAAALR